VFDAGTVIVPTLHATKAYAIFYPDATHKELMGALHRAFVVSMEVAITATRRKSPRNSSNSTYLMHEERSGIFVLEPDTNGLVLVTFLRFYGYDQHQYAVDLFGPPPTFTADTRYANLVRSDRTDIFAERVIVVADKADIQLEPEQIVQLAWRAMEADDHAESGVSKGAEFTTMHDTLKLYLRRDEKTAWVTRRRTAQEMSWPTDPNGYLQATVSPFVQHKLAVVSPALRVVPRAYREAWIHEFVLTQPLTDLDPSTKTGTFEGVPFYVLHLYRNAWTMTLQRVVVSPAQQAAIELLYHSGGILRWSPRTE
jgi:hypothetical protein